MEKSMQQSHGMGYKEYSMNLNRRLQVEKKRENDYKKCNNLVSEVERQVHR
ncbi:hypothetical protein ACFFJI_11175 [Allobacillus sp. GCM10007491]|uniref:Uncharacterized protein n=1 Tax=Allobacillus saliphilus TaxID=2912308 RepID=A0A941CWZ2_9BACI|nr:MULTISPECIES: hypothetical protein [Allobacillus]MBR7554714.1 hypothetical protein [Allobacillus saliphilus]